MQNSIALLYTNNKKLEFEIKKIPSTTKENSEDKPSIVNQMYLLKLKIIKQHKIKKLFSLFWLSIINMIPTVAQIFFFKK